MVDSTSSAIIVALSVIALFVWLSAVRKTIVRAEWDSAALFGALSVVLAESLVFAVMVYRGDWAIIRSRFELLMIVPAWGNLSIRLAYGVLAVVSVAMVFRAVRRNSTFNPAAVLFLAVTIVSTASAVLHGDNPIGSHSLVFLAVLIACTVAPRGLGIHVGIGTCTMIAGIASGFAIANHADFSVMPCEASKCGILGFLFRGIYVHENALAIALTLAMPFVFIAFSSWEGPVLSAYLLGLVLVSGSRSGSVAAVATFVLLILVRPNIRRPTWAPGRAAILYLVLAVAFVVGLALPFYTDDPAAFSYRGDLWMLARNALSDPSTLLHGTGMLGWQQEVRNVGMVGSYSVHNEWLHILYSTGLIGFLLVAVALVVLIRQAGRAYSLVVLSVLVPVFILSVGERPLPIDSANWVSWIVPGVLLCYPVARRLPGDASVETRRASPGPWHTTQPIADPQATTMSRRTRDDNKRRSLINQPVVSPGNPTDRSLVSGLREELS